MSDTIKRTIKGGAYFFASNVVSKGLGFLFIILSSRYLGPEEFGILALGISVSGLVRNIGSFGLPTTIQRFLSGEGEGQRTNNVYGGILTLFLATSLTFSIFLFLFSSAISKNIFNEPDLIIVLKIFAVGLFLEIGFEILRALLQAQEKIKEILYGNSAYSILKVLFLFFIFVWVKKAFVASLAIETAFFFALLYLIIQVKKLPFEVNLPSKEDLHKVLAYSLPLVFVGFSYFIAQQTDRIMLGWLSSSADVGVYTVSSTLALIMTALHGSLVSIFMPIASKAYRNQDMEELNKAYLFISKWVGSVNGILALLFTGAGVFLLNIFGAEYIAPATYQILIILTFLYFIGTWLGPTGALLQMADGHRIEMYNTAIYLTLNIGFNYIFILNYGLVGAAWGTLLSGLVRNLLQVLEIRYYYNLKVINRSNLLLLFVVMGGMLLSLVFNNYSLYLSALFIVFVVLHTVKTISDEEKQMIVKRIKKYV